MAEGLCTSREIPQRDWSRNNISYHLLCQAFPDWAWPLWTMWCTEIACGGQNGCRSSVVSASLSSISAIFSYASYSSGQSSQPPGIDPEKVCHRWFQLAKSNTKGDYEEIIFYPQQEANIFSNKLQMEIKILFVWINVFKSFTQVRMWTNPSSLGNIPGEKSPGAYRLASLALNETT